MRSNLAFERTSTSVAPRAAVRYAASRGATQVPAAHLVRWASQIARIDLCSRIC
jgi:hypothetical protein